MPDRLTTIYKGKNGPEHDVLEPGDPGYTKPHPMKPGRWRPPVVAAGDFDETKHPRDAHGRFGSKDDGEPAFIENAPVKGWHIETKQDFIDRRAIALTKSQRALPPDVARRAAQAEADDHPRIETWRAADGKTTLMFQPDVPVSAENKAMLANTLTRLSDLNPLTNQDGKTYGAAVIVKAQSADPNEPRGGWEMPKSVWGLTLGTSIDLNAQIFSDENSTRNNLHYERPGGISTGEEVLVHEYGHALDTVRNGYSSLVDHRPSDSGRAVDQAIASRPSASPYGATNPQEGYAEAFAKYYLTPYSLPDDSIGPTLARIEGWKKP